MLIFISLAMAPVLITCCVPCIAGVKDALLKLSCACTIIVVAISIILIYRVPQKKQGLRNYVYFELKNGCYAINFNN
jgi:predicted tellurium resistance membrane protein TerC